MNKYATPTAILILAAVLFVGLFDVSFEVWHGRANGWRGTWQYAVDQCVREDTFKIEDTVMRKMTCEANGDLLAAQLNPKGYKERWRYEGSITSRLR